MATMRTPEIGWDQEIGKEERNRDRRRGDNQILANTVGDHQRLARRSRLTKRRDKEKNTRFWQQREHQILATRREPEIGSVERTRDWQQEEHQLLATERQRLKRGEN